MSQAHVDGDGLHESRPRRNTRDNHHTGINAVHTSPSTSRREAPPNRQRRRQTEATVKSSEQTEAQRVSCTSSCPRRKSAGTRTSHQGKLKTTLGPRDEEDQTSSGRGAGKQHKGATHVRRDQVDDQRVRAAVVHFVLQVCPHFRGPKHSCWAMDTESFTSQLRLALVGLQTEEATIDGDAVFYEVIGVRQPGVKSWTTRQSPLMRPDRSTSITRWLWSVGWVATFNRSEITTHLLCRPSPSAQESLFGWCKQKPLTLDSGTLLGQRIACGVRHALDGTAAEHKTFKRHPAHGTRAERSPTYLQQRGSWNFTPAAPSAPRENCTTRAPFSWQYT